MLLHAIFTLHLLMEELVKYLKMNGVFTQMLYLNKLLNSIDGLPNTLFHINQPTSSVTRISETSHTRPSRRSSVSFSMSNQLKASTSKEESNISPIRDIKLLFLIDKKLMLEILI
jgi:hypothetical protein